MGTYTTNKNLFMPTVGETGWGTLVNGNFETIDNFLKPITVSGSTYTFTGNHVGNQSGGSISATSITNSGTLTNTGTSTFTGKITGNGGIGTTSLTTSSTITSTGQIIANGGVKGNLTGNVTGLLFVKGVVGTSGDEDYATLAAQSSTNSNNTYYNSSSPLSFTIKNYSISYGNPQRHTWGVYTRRSDLSGTTSPSTSSRSVTFTVKNETSGPRTPTLYYKLSSASSYTSVAFSSIASGASGTKTLNLAPGTYNFYINMENFLYLQKVSVAAGTTYKVKYATP